MTVRPVLRPWHLPALITGLSLCLCFGAAFAADPARPVSSQQRQTAQQVAQAGVALSELAPNAPDSHTVQPRDTLWDISKLFLTSPWRWPELWGMNLEQIRNPHLIYPGQVLVLDKSSGRARLRLAQAGGGAPSNVVKLSPRAREQVLDNGAIASIPLHLIGPFLNEAVILDDNSLANAPRIVAAPEGRVNMSQGDQVYVRGDLGGLRNFRLFREAKPLIDPQSREVLGYEARYVGLAEFIQAEGAVKNAKGETLVVPATFHLKSVRQEAVVGDRLAPLPAGDLSAFQPHAPAGAMHGQVISVYGDALNAGQNQIVSLSRGAKDGLERGHVLALWRAGELRKDPTAPLKEQAMRLPDERHGLLFVFRVFERTAYALIVSAQDPVRAGDRFSEP
jgi:LysM domain